MKFLIIGLGNIGADYEGTRHNIGFDVVDKLAGELGISFTLDRHAFVGQGNHKGKTFVLVKPTTYMNLSGQALRYWMQKEKIDAEQVLVITDDLNLDFGVARLKANGSSGGHNGLKSIEETLGNGQYARLRVGIGNEFSKGRQVDFVLGKWSAEEAEKLPLVVAHCADAAKQFALAGLSWTMNRYNKNVLAPPPPPKNNQPETPEGK